VFAFRSPTRALATDLPSQDYVYKTFRLHNKNLDEMRCKMDSTENPRSFEKYYLKKIATKTKKKVGVSKTCVILGKQLHLAQPWRVLGGWARTKITWSS